MAPGEVVGLAGVIGSGRTELCEAIYGLRTIDSGEIRMRGASVDLTEPKLALSQGVFLLPEDRKLDGIFADLDVRENLVFNRVNKTMTRGDSAGDRASTRGYGLRTINGSVERDAFAQMRQSLSIRCPSATAPITTLSGGNQQKTLFARGALSQPSVLILAEPTRGVDVGAKEEIYAAIDGFAAQGIAIIVSSSEISELIRLCDRVLVLRDGAMVGAVAAEAATEQTILEMMAG